MEKEYFDSCGQVIRDYFREFIKGFCMERTQFFALFLGPGIIAVEGVWDTICRDGIFINWLIGIPILYALASGAFHTVSLPFMMYLVPCSRKQRERYIQRMLVVKVAVPVGFGCLCDVAAACMGSLSMYVFVLQMASIFFISCLWGMLHDGGMYMEEKEAAYGMLWPFAVALLLICNLGGTAMFVICMGSVSQVEFWVILSVMVLILMPILVAVGKRWKQIRRFFADYEMAAGVTE